MNEDTDQKPDQTDADNGNAKRVSFFISEETRADIEVLTRKNQRSRTDVIRQGVQLRRVLQELIDDGWKISATRGAESKDILIIG